MLTTTTITCEHKGVHKLQFELINVWNLELDITRSSWIKLKLFDSKYASCKSLRRRKGKYLSTYLL
jgi:hypothetical protein